MKAANGSSPPGFRQWTAGPEERSRTSAAPHLSISVSQYITVARRGTLEAPCRLQTLAHGCRVVEEPFRIRKSRDGASFTTHGLGRVLDQTGALVEVVHAQG